MGYKFNPFTGNFDLVGGGGAGGSFSAGISTLGNTSGTSGTVSNQLILAGGNNITLSQSTGAGGATITISGANLGGAQTGISSIGNSETTYTSGAIQLIGSNMITVRSTTGQGFVIDATQTTQVSNVYLTGNTSLTSSNTYNAASLILRADGILSAGVSSDSLFISAPGSTAFQFVSNTSNITSNAMNTSERNNFVYSSANLNLTNVSATLGSNAISLSVAAPTGGGAALKGSGTYTQNTGTIEFANSNGITFGLSNNGTMTASHNGITQQSTQPVAASASNGSFNFSTLKFVETNGVTWATSTDGIRASVKTDYLTTAMASDAGSRFVNTSAGLNLTNISATFNSNSISLSVAAQSAQPVAASASNGSFNFSTLKFVEGSGVTWATQANGIQASVKTDYQSSNANYLTSQSNQAVSGANGSFTFQTLTFAGSNGITFSTGTQGLYASYTVPTQTNQSAIKAFGVSNTGNTAGNTGVSTGVDWVLAGSSSLTLSQSTAAGGPNTVWIQHPAWITTAMQSNAATISNIKVSAGTLSANRSDITFANSNGVTFGLETNGQITASINAVAGGFQSAGMSNLGNTSGTTGMVSNQLYLAGGNNVTLSQSINGGNATITISAGAGGGGIALANSQTTYTSGTANLSGAGAITIQSTTGQSFQISVPQTSSLSATGLVSLSTNGSTISIGVADKTIYMWQPYGLGLSSNTSIGVSSIFFSPLLPESNVSMSWVEQVWSNNISSSAANQWSRSMTFNYGLYSLNGASLSLISSSSVGMSMTASSNVSKAFTYGYGTDTVTFSTATSNHPAWDVQKVVRLPFNLSMSAGGQYFWAQQISTASGGANVNATWSQLFNAEATMASFALLEWTATSASTRFNVLEPYGFIRSATSGGLPSAMATTDASIYSNYQPYLLFEKHT